MYFIVIFFYSCPSCRSSFSDFAAKYGKDERFKGIEKMREREGLFSDHVSDLRRREKEEKSSMKEKVRRSLRFVVGVVGAGGGSWPWPAMTHRQRGRSVSL